MDGDKVDPMAPITRQSRRLAAARRELKETGGCTEGNPKKVSRREMDNVANEGGEDQTAVDGSSQPKKSKKAELVQDQKNARKDEMKKVAPAATSAIPGPSGSSSQHERPVNKSTPCGVKQMQQIQSTLDELKNVPDITELINDNTGQMTASFKQSASSAPAMVSEGIGGRFQTVNFYWLDMFEDPGSPGVLFIFGKVKSPPPGNGYSSGCIVVNNLKRRVFLLPRETKANGTPVDHMDVYNEFHTVAAPQYKIPSFECKRSKRKYCFDIEGIPPEAEYMEVRYSSTAPALPQDVKGETFSHAFGTNTSLMETFLLEKKLKGPSWLQLSYCERVQPDQQQSWSKFEFTCDVSHVNIHPESFTFPVPTLVLASLQTETVYDSDLKRKVFIFAGVAVHGNFSLQLPSLANEICHDFFCLINTPPGHNWPSGVESITNNRILKMESELSMLECLVNKLHELDADVYLQYGKEVNRLLNRLSDVKVPNRSRIGRLQRPTNVAKKYSRCLIPGRLLCDMTTSSMTTIIGNYSAFLKKRNGKKQVMSSLASSEMKASFKSSKDLQSFVKWGMKHCVLKIREINELQVLPLAFQSACIAGNTLYGALGWKRVYRSENLLLHALSTKNYIVPDDCQLETDAVAKSQVVQGLTSEEGFYDNYVIQLRFNSVWLCPCALAEFGASMSNLDADVQAEEPRRTMQNELRKLDESRRQIESLMKMKSVTEDAMQQYDIRLQAFQTTTFDVMFNSQELSRFRSKTLKAYVQVQVRDFLLKIKEIVTKMGYKVIYGNESSVMIQTHSREISIALEIGKKIQQEIGRTFTLFWDCSSGVGVYRRLLILKGNRYAGLLYNQNKESQYEVDLEHFTAGLSGQLPSFVCKTARACLTEILSEQRPCDKTYKVGKILWDVSSRLRSGAVPLEDLLISKTLTQNPEEYGNVEGLDYVTVALRINKNEKLGKTFRKGDRVSYVLCKDGCPRLLSEMESTKEEDKNVQVDADYYLAQMIHPVVSEICERIPELGLDPARVMDALGLGVSSSSSNSM